jgi:hypothetical protein
VSAPALVALILAAWLLAGCLAALPLDALLRRRRIEQEHVARAYAAHANLRHGERSPSASRDAAASQHRRNRRGHARRGRARPSARSASPSNRTQGGSHATAIPLPQRSHDRRSNRDMRALERRGASVTEPHGTRGTAPLLRRTHGLFPAACPYHLFHGPRPVRRPATASAPELELSGSSCSGPRRPGRWNGRTAGCHVRPRSGLAVNGHRFLPNCGHRFSPPAAMFSPRWRPSVLPIT